MISANSSETFEVWTQSNWTVCKLFQRNIQAILYGLVTLKQNPSVLQWAQHVHERDIYCEKIPNSVTIEPDGKLHCPKSALPHYGDVNATPGPPSVHSQHSKFRVLNSLFKDSIASSETSAIDTIKSIFNNSLYHSVLSSTKIFLQGSPRMKQLLFVKVINQWKNINKL